MKYALLLVLAMPLALLAQTAQSDPFIGTWKLDTAKSKFDPGPPLTSQTVTIRSDGKVSVEGTASNGNVESWSYTYARGTQAQITGMEDSSVLEKRSGNTLEHAWKFGPENFKGKGVLSNDGRIMTYTMDGIDNQGRHEHDILIYDRAAESESTAAAGTWKLNVSKSEFSPGPAPASDTVIVGADHKITVNQLQANGETMNYSFTPSEGTAVPVMGMPDSTVLEKRIDSRTVEHTWKMGEMTLMGRGVISEDGKTMTYTMTGTTPNGTPIHNVEILEKQ